MCFTVIQTMLLRLLTNLHDFRATGGLPSILFSQVAGPGDGLFIESPLNQHMGRKPSYSQPVRLLMVHLDSKEVVTDGKRALLRFVG